LVYFVRSIWSGFNRFAFIIGAFALPCQLDRCRTLGVEVKYASDGSTHSLATVDARTTGDPYTRQFTGT
jgi:hypothetical protein